MHKNNKISKKKTVEILPIEERRFDRFFIVSCVIVTVLWVIHNKTTDRVIYENKVFPFIVGGCGFLIGLVVMFFIRKVIFNIYQKFNSYLTTLATIIKSSFLSVLIFSTLFSWSFSYMNENYAKDSTIFVQSCKISYLNLQVSGSHHSISFIFNGIEETIDNFSSNAIMLEADRQKDLSNYRVQLKYKKGLFKTYLIEEWSVNRIK